MMCEPGARVPLRVPVLGAAALAAAGAALAVAPSVMAAMVAVSVVILAACPVCAVLTVRFIARSRAGFGVVAADRCAPRVLAQLEAARRAIEASPLAIEGKPVLTAPQRALEAPRPVVHAVITDVRERAVR